MHTRKGLWSWLQGVWIRCTIKQCLCWLRPNGRSASCPSARCVPFVGSVLVAMLLTPWLGCIYVLFLTAFATTSGVTVAPPCFCNPTGAWVAGCTSIKLHLRSFVGGLHCLLLSPHVALLPRSGLWCYTPMLLLCAGACIVPALTSPASSLLPFRQLISVLRSCLLFSKGSWPFPQRSTALMWN